MAIQQNRTVFQAPSSRSNSSSDEEFTPAEFYLNIGMPVGEGEEARFVSLPVGVPLDTMRRAKVSGTGDFAEFKAHQNDLLDQVISVASKLNPGEAMMLEGSCSGLHIELRRRNTQSATPSEGSKYKVNFSGQATAAAKADAAE